jgi:hypothetical protein
VSAFIADSVGRSTAGDRNLIGCAYCCSRQSDPTSHWRALSTVDTDFHLFLEFERCRTSAPASQQRTLSIIDTCPIYDTPANTRRNASWARLIQKFYEVDPLECTRYGATMHIIALIDNADVVDRILRHLNLWDPPPETFHCVGPDLPSPKGETIPLSYHPEPDIA